MFQCCTHEAASENVIRRLRTLAPLIKNDDSDREPEMKGECSLLGDTDLELSNDFRHAAQHKREIEFRCLLDCSSPGGFDEVLNRFEA